MPNLSRERPIGGGCHSRKFYYRTTFPSLIIAPLIIIVTALDIIGRALKLNWWIKKGIFSQLIDSHCSRLKNQSWRALTAVRVDPGSTPAIDKCSLDTSQPIIHDTYRRYTISPRAGSSFTIWDRRSTSQPVVEVDSFSSL